MKRRPDRQRPVVALHYVLDIGVAAWPHMHARYTFVDLDTAGTALVWAWTFGRRPSIDRNQQLVDTIQFAD
jgi:hypothetical protein